MTSSVTPVQMWKCPTTGKLFDTPEAAEKSQRSAKAAATRKKNKEKKEKERAKLVEYQSNYVRLNATSLEDIPNLMMAKAKEFWGINICVTFARSGFSEKSYEGGNYIDRPNYKFRIRITGDELGDAQKATFKKLGADLKNRYSISDTVVGGHWWGSNPSAFKGIKLGSGNGGHFGDSGLDFDATIYLSEFPLIEQKYKKYVSLKGPVEEWNRKIDQINKSAREFTSRTRLVSEQRAICNAIRDELEKENGLLNVLITSAEEEYKEFCGSKLVQPPLIPCELINMFS